MLKMNVVLSGLIGGLSLKDYAKTGRGLSFGGYSFTIPLKEKNLEVNFDFPGYAANIQEDGTLLLEAGAATVFGDNSYLDDCYNSEYAALGIKREDLTAKVLASAVRINEFAVDCDDEFFLELSSIEFRDETGTYTVDPEVVKAFSFANERKHIQLEIGLDKITNRYHPDGNQSRYFHVFVDGKDVTKEIAELAGLTMSVTGSLIVHGCGMDMGFWLQNRVYQRACMKGHPNLFDPDHYKYLGKRRGYCYVK